MKLCLENLYTLASNKNNNDDIAGSTFKRY